MQSSINFTIPWFHFQHAFKDGQVP